VLRAAAPPTQAPRPSPGRSTVKLPGIIEKRRDTFGLVRGHVARITAGRKRTPKVISGITSCLVATREGAAVDHMWTTRPARKRTRRSRLHGARAPGEAHDLRKRQAGFVADAVLQTWGDMLLAEGQDAAAGTSVAEEAEREARQRLLEWQRRAQRAISRVGTGHGPAPAATDSRRSA
jgi:hypothetical protein